MIPLNVIQNLSKIESAGSVREIVHNLTKPEAKGAKPQVHVNLTAVRVTVAFSLSLCLAGFIIATQWGGRGLFYREPERSVRPGINAEWVSGNTAAIVARLETDANELYRERSQIAALLGFREGDDVAEVGSGSGAFAEEVVKRVGSAGRVTAVELNQSLVDRTKARAEAAGTSNLRAHLGQETKLNINRRDGGNFDYVVLAGSYHHLEYPKSMLYSIDRLLRRRGQLIIIEPHRVPGESPETVLEHVRLDRAGVIREVSANGFKLVEEVPTPFLRDHYVLRFVKD